MNEEIEHRRAMREAGYEDPNDFTRLDYDPKGPVEQLPYTADIFGGYR